MSMSLSTRTLSELQPDELVIDLTDVDVVLAFAECVRNLSSTRMKSIWNHNVQLHHKVQPKTKLQHQIDDILLYLIIIFGKEQYPNEEQELISKLKQFVASKPFKIMKQYIQQKYFPLYQDAFINNKDYFANIIMDFAQTHLINFVNAYSTTTTTTQATPLPDGNTAFRHQPSSIATINGHVAYTNLASHVIPQPSVSPTPSPYPDGIGVGVAGSASVSMNNMHKMSSVGTSSIAPSLSRSSTPTTLNMEAIMYSKLEDKITERVTELFMAKFGDLEHKINELSKEVMTIKYALTEEAKQNTFHDYNNPTADQGSDANPTSGISHKSTEDLFKEISVIKGQIGEIQKKMNKKRRGSSSNRPQRPSTVRKRSSAKRLSVIDGEQQGQKGRTKSDETGIKIIKPRVSVYTKEEIEERKKRMKEWLDNECEMGEYYEMFVENGLDNLSIMKHVSITDLALLGVGKLQHRVKIMQHIHKLKMDLKENKENNKDIDGDDANHNDSNTESYL